MLLHFFYFISHREHRERGVFFFEFQTEAQRWRRCFFNHKTHKNAYNPSAFLWLYSDVRLLVSWRIFCDSIVNLITEYLGYEHYPGGKTDHSIANTAYAINGTTNYRSRHIKRDEFGSGYNTADG